MDAGVCKRAYDDMWEDVHVNLKNLLKEERRAKNRPPDDDPAVFLKRVARFYVRYIQIFRQLERLYDQGVHPQKRPVMRAVLDGVMGRLLELKNEMVEKYYSEYHYMNDVLRFLKLQPADLDIPIPHYFFTERNTEFQEERTMLANMLKTEEIPESPEPPSLKDMTLEDAIRIIEKAEKKREAKMNEENKTETADSGRSATEMAAVCIQKMWRGYIVRKKAKISKEEQAKESQEEKKKEPQEEKKKDSQEEKKAPQEEKLTFLEMAMESMQQGPCPAKITARAKKASTRIKQRENEEDYQKSIVTVTKQLLQEEGPDISNTMKDQIRQWFIECRDSTGAFPDYPGDEDGGSAIMFQEMNPKQLIEELAEKELEEARAKAKGKDEKDKGKKDEKAVEKEEEMGLKMQPSVFLSDLKMGHKTYVDFWKRRNESKNFSQRHDVELIKEEQRKVIEAELRLQIDEEMRQELARLKLAVDKDKGGKAKKPKPPKAKKEKQEKDLTADRTLESLCQELVEQDLLKKAKDVRLKDFLGDYSYFGTTHNQFDKKLSPSLSDVRQVLTLYAVLPLGSQVIHEKAPLTKSMLLAGPAGTGKKMLVHAICNETGANLFDLSPKNTAGKYPGSSGVAMMLHIVFKVAKLLHPSVIWIDDAHKIFYKKVPKEDKPLDPKRLKKDLLKSLKLIKEEDRVLIIGTAKDPISAEIKSLCKMYSKIILVPKPNYGSRYILWKQLIQKHRGEITKALDLSTLAKISDGYTPGHMVQVIQSVLTRRRVRAQPKRPLTVVEFVGHLAKLDPVSPEEEEALKTWFKKTPLGAKKAAVVDGQ